MRILKKTVIICCIVLFGGLQTLLAITNNTNSSKQKNIQADDPIAAMLDSLQTLKLFECSSYTTDTCILNTYNYCPDLIPYFDDLTIESRLNRLDKKSPFDLIFNESVKNYVELYANKKRSLVSKVLGLSNLYFNMFEEQLDKYNLPLELKYLAIVESALNPTAISRTGAAGLWQFMLPTGKMFGLDVNSYVDERKDPYKSTLAACKYLKYLYNLFGDWQMVLAAYNSGPGTVSKAIRRSGGKTNYWEVRPFLPTETQNYVPAFIAVNYVMNYSREHNLYPVTVKSTYFFADTIHVKKQINFQQISSFIDLPIDEIKFLNPAYKLGIVPFDEDGSALCLPANKVGTFINNENEIYNYKPEIITTKFITKQLSKSEKIYYKAKSKESLASIAYKNNVTVNDLKKWNKLSKNTVNKGKLLTIYKSQNSTENKTINIETVIANKGNSSTDDYNKTSISTNNDEGKNIDIDFSDKNKIAFNDSVAKKNTQLDKSGIAEGYILHTVTNGDTLWNIANRYKGTSVNEIIKLNNISKNKTLKVGEKIKVPIS
jgi:membrane-bound lytic murein transglycosylase D